MYDEESTYNYNQNGRCSLHKPIGKNVVVTPTPTGPEHNFARVN
jgi:hypothetical protein